MYNKIINPLNGYKVNINSINGKNILRNYLSVLLGASAAGASAAPRAPDTSIKNSVTRSNIDPSHSFYHNLKPRNLKRQFSKYK